MAKVKVTIRGQKVIHTLYVVYLVNIITIIICRCVPYKTCNSLLKVMVTESRGLYKCFDIWALHVAPGHLVLNNLLQMFTMMDWCVAQTTLHLVICIVICFKVFLL